MEQPCEEACQQILGNIEFWSPQPLRETNGSPGPWCTFISKQFGHIRCATGCPLCRIVFQALTSADNSEILNDEMRIYYSNELLVEYKKIRIKENLKELKETSSQLFQIKYLGVSTCFNFGECPRELAFIGAPAPLRDDCCEAKITQIHESKRFDNEFLFCERPITAQVDTQRIKQWLATCDTNHFGCSTTPFAHKLEIWMINVRLGMLEKVILAEICYAALSFCHGAGYYFFFDDANALRFQTKGFLSKTNREIPKTIRDAISVTAELDLDYLWVDTLCIPHMSNSSASKPYVEIFRQSYVTLVATGENAACGLFGIDSSDRKSQAKETHGNLSLAVSKKSVHQILQESKWNFRRWTFEENIQSKRILIFSEEQVFFNCQQSFWAEAVWLEGFDDEPLEDLDLRPVEDQAWLRGWPKQVLDKFSFKDYAGWVNNYSERNSPQPTDHLKAFQSFSSSPPIIKHKISLFHGLPRGSIFAEALCFEVYDGMRPKVERQDVPSWSWQYWKASSGVYRSNILTIWAQRFYEITEDTENDTQESRWSPIGQATNASAGPIKYGPRLPAKEINRTVGAFDAFTIMLNFLHWDEDSPGVAILSISEREVYATLSQCCNAIHGTEIKALLVMIDDQDVPPHLNFLLLQQGPKGIFRRVGMCEFYSEETEWMESCYDKITLAREHIFIQ
ncbi:hypothetical protein N7540_000135 [Penicillium herquei]|nr:hypothetical protein N7540_000135 [Penicillium herquei]